MLTGGDVSYVLEMQTLHLRTLYTVQSVHELSIWKRVQLKANVKNLLSDASVCYIWSYWPLRDAQKNLQFNFSVKAFSHQHVFIFLSATTFPILSNISQTQLILQVFLTKT